MVRMYRSTPRSKRLQNDDLTTTPETRLRRRHLFLRPGKRPAPKKAKNSSALRGVGREDSRQAASSSAESVDHTAALTGTEILPWPRGDSHAASDGPANDAESRALRRTPFSGKLAAILALRRQISRRTVSEAGAGGTIIGSAATLDVLEPNAEIVLRIEASSPPSGQRATNGCQPLQVAASGGSGSSAGQRTAPASRYQQDLSAEERRLLQGTASNSPPAPPRAANLSAFAALPDIPTWQKPPPKRQNVTLRESFMKQRADPEQTIKLITRDK